MPYGERMIVVHTAVRCLPADRPEFVALLKRMQAATRALDDGCLLYSYVADLDDDCRFTGVEEWRDLDALRAHLAAPHMNDPHSRFNALCVDGEQVTVFQAQPVDFEA